MFLAEQHNENKRCHPPIHDHLYPAHQDYAEHNYHDAFRKLLITTRISHQNITPNLQLLTYHDHALYNRHRSSRPLGARARQRLHNGRLHPYPACLRPCDASDPDHPGPQAPLTLQLAAYSRDSGEILMVLA